VSKPLKKVFKSKEGNNEVELAIVTPSSHVHQKARLVYAKAWREAVEGGAIMKEALDRYLREQKLWDDIREREFKRLRHEILEGERSLKAGGNAGLTLHAAKELALRISDLRDEMADLLTERNRVAANTADTIAENAQFNYYVSACTVYNTTGNQVFSSLDNYIERAGEQMARDAAAKFAEYYYGSDDDVSPKLPEQEFLKEYKFADDKGRLVDKKGRLVDREGRLIDENKRFINDKGEFVDIDGNRVDENGQYIVDFAPFLPDEADGRVEEKPKVVEKKEELVETGK
jgi:hypothetical protein